MKKVENQKLLVHSDFHITFFPTIKVNVDQQRFGFPHSSKYLILCLALEIN